MHFHDDLFYFMNSDRECLSMTLNNFHHKSFSALKHELTKKLHSFYDIIYFKMSLMDFLLRGRRFPTTIKQSSRKLYER